jgi:hypothetical protein
MFDVLFDLHRHLILHRSGKRGQAKESLASKNKSLAAVDKSNEASANNHWHEPTRLGIHASSKQSAKGDC